MPPSLPDVQTGPRMSLGTRLMNVFTGPGEVFDEVKKGPPSNANWLVPVLLICLVGIVATFVIFSQDSILQQIREQQDRAIEKKLEKLPKEQREQAREIAEKWTSPALMKLFGSGGTIARAFGSLFLIALVLWLLGTRLFKGSFGYMQAVEVCGLAGMISVLGGIIRMLLVVVTGSMLATPGPALLIRDLNPSSLTHLLLSALNVATIWYAAVLAIGLAKLSGARLARAAGWVFALWALVTGGFTVLGWLGQRAFT